MLILHKIARAIFSPVGAFSVAAVVLAAMWWHNLTIADPLDAQRAVGIDTLFLLPLGLVWAVRAFFMPMTENQKGGEQ